MRAIVGFTIAANTGLGIGLGNLLQRGFIVRPRTTQVTVMVALGAAREGVQRNQKYHHGNTTKNTQFFNLSCQQQTIISYVNQL